MKIHHEKAYTSIMTLGQSIGPAWQKMLAELGITAAQAEVVLAITDNTINIRRLSELLGVTSSAATQLVETLQKRGTVTRENSNVDRRIVNVSLTKNGTNIQSKLIIAQKKLIEQIVGSLTEHDVQELERIHSKMITNL